MLPISPRTEQAYYACLRQLGEFYSKAPDLISPEQLRQYFIHLKCDKEVARQTSTQALCAIKLFWEKTLRRPWPAEVQLVRANHQFKLPVVLSASETRRILAAVPALDHRVCLSTIYSCGLRLSVHQLIRRLAPDYLQRFGSSMPGRQRQVLNKLLSCRTPARGGQLYQCPGCSGFEYRYHSCNDRHCPQCGQTDADAWLQRQKARLLLPTPHFLVTFTVPEELRRLFRAQMRITLDLFFAVTSKALHDLAANPRRLGAQLGMLGVLHTWARSLIFHPHIHYLIPGGGLSPDGRTWVAARKNFLLHHQALGAHVRTLFKQRLLKQHPALFAQVPAQVWNNPWNVGAQAVGSGENALRYLSRYVFKTATSNRQVKLLAQGKVLWTYRQSKTRKFTSIQLEPLQFLSRFLQHVLPPHFARVRSFGWFQPAAKVRLNRVRALLRQAPLLTDAENKTWNPPAPSRAAAASPAPGLPTACTPFCSRCQQPMRLIASWKAAQPVPWPRRPRPPP